MCRAAFLKYRKMDFGNFDFSAIRQSDATETLRIELEKTAAKKTRFSQMDFLPQITCKVGLQHALIPSNSNGMRVVFDLENETYHRTSHLSSSKLNRLIGATTEMQVAAALRQRVTQTKPMVTGSLLHGVCENLANRLEGAPVRIVPEFALNSSQSVADGIAFYESFLSEAGHEKHVKHLRVESGLSNYGGTEFQRNKDYLKSLIEFAKSEFNTQTEHDSALVASLQHEIMRLNIVQNLMNVAIAEVSIFDDARGIKIRPDLLIPRGVFGNFVMHISIKSTASLAQYGRAFGQGAKAQIGFYADMLERTYDCEVINLFLLIDTNFDICQIKMQEVSEQTLQSCKVEYKSLYSRFLDVIEKHPESLCGYEAEGDFCELI